MNVQKGYSNI